MPDANVEKFNPKEENPIKKGFPKSPKKLKPDDSPPENKEEWEPVTDRHQLRNKKERYEITRVMPKLDAIMAKSMKSNTEKPPLWIIAKYQLIQTLIEEGKEDTTKLKVKSILQHIRRIATGIDCTSELFSAKKLLPKIQKKWITNSLPPESLHAEFEQNTEEFDFDSEHEIDITEMPDLLMPDEETSVGTTEQEAIDLYNSMGEEDANSETTDGARHVINLEDIPGNIGANPTSKTDDASPLSEPADDTPIQDKGQPVNKQEHLDNNLDDPTQRVDDQFKKTELILDKEAQEINSIPIHAPKMHYHDTSCKDYDVEREVAKAINRQRQNIDKQTREQTLNMVAKWKAMATQQQTRLTEQADFQSSVAMQEHNSAREEFLQLRADIETARQTLDIVLAQTDMLQETTSDRHRDLTNLITEAKQVGTSIQRDTVIIRDLVTVTKAETTKLRQAFSVGIR
jgi:hypothetical protein